MWWFNVEPSAMRRRLRWLLLVMVCARAGAEDVCPDTHPWTGKVRDYSFGFTFVIPAGLEGYWNSARCVSDAKEGCTCMSDDGRLVPLGKKPEGVDRKMEMYADHGADIDSGTLGQAVRALLQRPEGVSGWRVTRNRPWRLGPLKARWVETRYVDAKTGTAMVREEVAAWRGGAAFYRPYLLTPASDLAVDLPKFRAMLRSFRLKKGEY